MTRRSLPAWIACVLFGCQAARPPRTPAEGAARASASAATAAEYSVVWAELDDGRRSFWLESTAEKLTILGERPGSIFLWRGGAYRWKPTSAERSSMDCDDFYNPPNTDADAEADKPAEKNDLIVNGAVAERLDRAGEIELVGLEPLENASSYENSATLIASVDGQLFIETSSDELYCGGAHGFRTHHIEVFDLESRAFQDYPEPSKRDLVQRAGLEQDRETLLQCVTEHRTAEERRQLGNEGLEAVALVATIPRWSLERGLYLELGWGLSESYASGDEGWGSYTSSCADTNLAVPAALGLPPAPRALAQLIALYPKAKVGGWSRLEPAQLAQLDALNRAFATEEK
jgi:hypothetical protein